MSSIQEAFNACVSGDFRLDAGEYQGPLTVDRPCVIDGNMATLWASEGPVLTVKASGVTIRNFRIEITRDETAVKDYEAVRILSQNVKLENVEVKGNISGLPDEPEKWELPSLIAFGEFASGQTNTFRTEIVSAADAAILNEIHGLSISPLRLVKGNNAVSFTVEPMRDNTILYGEILVESVKSAVKRRIYISGRAMNGAPLSQSASALVEKRAESQPVQFDQPEEKITPDVVENKPQNAPENKVQDASGSKAAVLCRGQRIGLGEYAAHTIRFTLEKRSLKRHMEIDGYAFLLQGNGKVSCDEDLVFFGNPTSVDNAVTLSESGGASSILVRIPDVSAGYDKIAVCFAIYGDDPALNFSMVDSPAVQICSEEKEIYRFVLDRLAMEKTLVAVELYRYKGEWKLNCVGAGFRNGLKKLCESYGVDVAE